MCAGEPRTSPAVEIGDGKSARLRLPQRARDEFFSAFQSADLYRPQCRGADGVLKNGIEFLAEHVSTSVLIRIKPCGIDRSFYAARGTRMNTDMRRDEHGL